jgi:hypothetical protein
VAIDSHNQGGIELLKLTGNSNFSIAFPRPKETKIQSIVLKFVHEPTGRFDYPKHTYLRFTAIGDKWEIKRATCSPSLGNPNPPVNFDNGYEVNLKGRAEFLHYRGLKEITLEMKAPKVDGDPKVTGVVPLGAKPARTKNPRPPPSAER